MKTFQTIEAAANLKGMAKHTYSRVATATAEDTTAAMLHAFAALTDGAKAVALQAGKFSNLYIRGERKGMAVEEAAKELTERAAAGVTRKLRKIDTVCAVAFLAEYISRQRKAIETPETPNTTPAAKCLTMYLDNTAEIYDRYTMPAIDACAKAQTIKAPEMWEYIKKALKAAARMVIKCDHLTPTPSDIDQAARDYIAYIVECAQYENANA